MTPETMILIATLASGAVEWQAIPSDLCRHVVVSMERGAIVQGERDDGSLVTMVSGVCIPDTLMTRLELTPPHYGACMIGEDA